MVYAGGVLDGQPVRSLTLGLENFVSAPATFWVAQGFDQQTADEFGADAVAFHADEIGLDTAAALGPVGLAAALEEVLAAVDTTVEAAVGPTGEGVLRYSSALGTADVASTGAPRLVELRLVGMAELLPASFGYGEAVAGFSPESVGPYAELANDAMEIYETIRDGVALGAAEVELDMTSGSTCAAGGLCTISATVTARPLSEYWILTGVDVMLAATLGGPGVGTRSCSMMVTVPPSGSAPAQCQVDFALAPSERPETFTVTGDVTIVTYVPRWTPDMAKIGAVYNDAAWGWVRDYYDAVYGDSGPLGTTA